MSIVTDPVTVPEGFVGLHTNRSLVVPSSAVSSITRSWDYGGTSAWPNRAVVKYIRPSSGEWFWDTFDEFIGANPNKRLVVCLGQPADWMVTRTAIGGAYLSGKANMLPDDMPAYLEAVTAMVERARDEHGRSGLIWQIWNEFDQAASFADDKALLGAHTKQVSEVIRAIDSEATILAPAIAGHSFWLDLQNYLLSGDGAGGQASQWIDGVAMHYYVMDVFGYEHAIDVANGYSRALQAMAGAKVKLPIWITESGCKSIQPQIGQAFQRRMLTFAACGAQCFIGYTYDDTSFPVAPYEDEWNAAATLLSGGAVISSCFVTVGRVEITINGKSYVF